MTKQEVHEAAAKLCGALTAMGFEYHFEADNRASRKSVYIFVRSPRYMEIRVSDHPMGRKRIKTLDIGPHGITVEQAIEDIASWHAGR